MASLAELLEEDQAAALARLQLDLATASPPAGIRRLPECGQLRAAPAALFQAPQRSAPLRPGGLPGTVLRDV